MLKENFDWGKCPQDFINGITWEMAQGCYEKAREAVSCAIALDPKTTQWQQSLSELSTAVSQQPCVVSLICPVSD